MPIEELLLLVKVNLEIPDTSKDMIIQDMINEVLLYCNMTETPKELEPFIRKKVQTIINYELQNGISSVFDVKSIKEGDTSITYDVGDKVSRETVYGLSDRDKKTLQKFRRVRR